MRKIFTFILLLSVNLFSFALPNMKLYEEGKFVYEIKNDKLLDKGGEQQYIVKDGKLFFDEELASVGTVAEKNDTLIFDYYIGDKLYRHCEYNKTSGFLVLEEAYFWGKITTEYDERTGLKNKVSYYENEKLDSYTIYEYEKDKLSKSLYYKSDGSLESFSQITYDKKTGNMVLESVFDADKHLVLSYEYDSKTAKRIKTTEYNGNGTLKSETIYDKKSEKPTERLIYNENGKKPVKWTFLKFTDEGKYDLSDDFYLNSLFCWYSDLEKYADDSKKEPIDWNENYSAIIRKFNFNENTICFSYIENLKRSRYLSSSSFTLCNKNSNIFYCFTTDENDEIDLSSCYEIELIKKARDYPAMNKSGKGKGPFGFDIGMTYEEVKEACGGSEPEHISDDRYYVKPKKSHPLFEKYIVWISDSVGLYYIKAISQDIYSSDYGTEPKREFDKILSPLERKYGKFTKTDTIKQDYYWKDEKYWTQALRDGARTYRAEWYVTKDNYHDYDGLSGILLGIDAKTSSNAYIWLEYEFLNYDDAKDALNDVL